MQGLSLHPAGVRRLRQRDGIAAVSAILLAGAYSFVTSSNEQLRDIPKRNASHFSPREKQCQEDRFETP
jgi:hypothetical protein